MFLARFAILLDGAFVRKKLRLTKAEKPMAEAIVDYCAELQAHQAVKNYELLRIYYYEAPPSSDKTNYPVSQKDLRLADTKAFRESQQLHDKLIMQPGFALRMGETRLAASH